MDKLRASLPAGYSIEEGGAVAESDKGNSSVFTVLPVTLVIMLLLLMLQLRRYSRMLLALLMAPFGLPGIVLAMLPTGTPMGFVALLGVIALAGMIMRNAVILISEVDNNLAQGMPPDAAIAAAAEHRARPIVSDRLRRHSRDDPHLASGLLGPDGLCDYRRAAGGDAGDADRVTRRDESGDAGSSPS